MAKSARDPPSESNGFGLGPVIRDENRHQNNRFLRVVAGDIQQSQNHFNPANVFVSPRARNRLLAPVIFVLSCRAGLRGGFESNNAVKTGVQIARFATENELVEQFTERMFCLFPKMTVAAREIAGVDGIADIVLVRPKSAQDYTAALTTYAFAHKKLGRASHRASPFSDVVAIEAKLQDWRKGLYQATRYTQFAHRSYLLVSGNQVGKALEQYSVFAQSGIGLIGHMRSDFRVYISARRRVPLFAMSNAFFAPKGERHHFLRADAFEPFLPLLKMSECARSCNNVFRYPLGLSDAL